MANRYSVMSGMASVLATWDLGVSIPGTGDRVLISAGHTVTVDGTYEWGDDSVSSIVVNSVTTVNSITVAGTLQASRVVNSQLTCNGDLVTTASTGATLDWGTSASPIPVGVKATLILNKSAAMVNFKYGVYVADTSNAWFFGAAKTRNTTLVNTVAAAAVAFDVADGTGWRVGDRVVLAETDGNPIHYDDIASITSVTLVSGTRYTIGCAALAYGHAAGVPAGNFTSSVTLKAFTTTKPAYFCMRAITVASNSRREIQNISFEFVGSDISLINTKSFWAGTTTLKIEALIAMAGNSFYQGSASIVMFLYQAVSQLVFSGNAFFSRGSVGGNGPTCYFANGTTLGIANSVFYACGGAPFSSAYSQAGQGNAINNNKIWASESINLNYTNGSGLAMSGNSYHATTSATRGILSLGGGAFTFTGDNFGSSSLPGTPTFGYIVETQAFSLLQVTLKDCLFGTPALGFGLNLPNMLPGSYITVLNKNADVAQQEFYLPSGTFIRDNGIVYRSTSSVRAETATSAAFSKAVDIASLSGVPVTVAGYLRKNASYGSSTWPTVTLSGLGITPQTFTLSDSIDAWEAFSLTATQTSGNPGALTLTFTVQSASTAGRAYLDGVVQSPFVVWAQHYGYTYDPSNPVRTVDAVVQLTEAAAAALTGISYASGTLTISGTRSIREVYDWMKWYEASNRIAPIMTAASSTAFSLAGALVLSGSLTGSGTLTISGTFSGAGASTVSITHPAGVYAAVSVTGFTAGSRVQVFNVTTGIELYNAVPAGTSIQFNAAWTANQTLRVRVGYAVGLVAQMPVELSGLLTNAGASFLVAQVNDSVYTALGVDGSTCIEFTPDYPNLLIDVTDSDNITSVQRVYSWASWAQTSPQGIAVMFNGVTALDTLNFNINTAVVNAKLKNMKTTPLLMVGGYLSRSDGTTVIDATSGSIQMDPGKAYTAANAAAQLIAAMNATPPAVNVAKVNGVTIFGGGVPGSNTFRVTP